MSKLKNKRKNNNETYSIKKQIKKLENKKVELQNNLNDTNKNLKKYTRIRKLKLSRDVLNFTLPFVICTGISVGTISWLGFGLPFKKDNVNKFKRYDFSYCTDDKTELENTYERNSILDDELPSSKLSIYYPWEEDNGIYSRIKRVYDLDKKNYIDLQNAILNNDMDFINEYKESYKEEKQTCNKKLFNDEDNVTYIDCELHYFDKDDIIQVEESFYRNFLVTLIGLVVGMGVGAVVADSRKFSLRKNLKDIELYHFQDIDKCRININIISNNLDDVNRKLEELNKKLVKSNGTK